MFLQVYEFVFFFFQIFLKFIPWRTTETESALVAVMTWQHEGHKPLSKAILLKIIKILLPHYQMTRDNQLNLPNFLTESILCCRPIVITLELGHMFLKVKLATERKNDKYYNTVIIWATIIMLYSSFQELCDEVWYNHGFIGACLPGGHYLNYYPGALSLSQITAAHMKIIIHAQSSNEMQTWLHHRAPG